MRLPQSFFSQNTVRFYSGPDIGRKTECAGNVEWVGSPDKAVSAPHEVFSCTLAPRVPDFPFLHLPIKKGYIPQVEYSLRLSGQQI